MFSLLSLFVHFEFNVFRFLSKAYLLCLWLFTRPYVDSSLTKLWKSLFSHLVNVVENGVMKAEEVGDMFGSLLISQHSRHGKEVR